MKMPTRSQVKRVIAFAFIITAVVILVSEWRVRHRPAVARGWPIVFFVSNAGETGVGIAMRNTYGRTLFYSGSDRIYRLEADEWVLVRTILDSSIHRFRPNTVSDGFVHWSHPLMPVGQYRLARDFFRNSRATEVYKTLYADFEIVCWQTRADTRVDYDLGGVSQWRKDYVAIVTSGAPSRAIVQAGQVQVSRTAITFMSRNRTFMFYSHGLMWELAHYVNGTWEPVPHSPSDYSRAWLLHGIGVPPRGWWPDTKEFAFWFGELPPGRYLFMRNHSHSRGGHERYTGYMMFEFVIDENTPVYLPGDAGIRAIISGVVYGVIVRVGFVIGFVMMFRFLRRLKRNRRCH